MVYCDNTMTLLTLLKYVLSSVKYDHQDALWSDHSNHFAEVVWEAFDHIALVVQTLMCPDASLTRTFCFLISSWFSNCESWLCTWLLKIWKRTQRYDIQMLSLYCSSFTAAWRWVAILQKLILCLLFRLRPLRFFPQDPMRPPQLQAKRTTPIQNEWEDLCIRRTDRPGVNVT